MKKVYLALLACTIGAFAQAGDVESKLSQKTRQSGPLPTEDILKAIVKSGKSIEEKTKGCDKNSVNLNGLLQNTDNKKYSIAQTALFTDDKNAGLLPYTKYALLPVVLGSAGKAAQTYINNPLSINMVKAGVIIGSGLGLIGIVKQAIFSAQLRKNVLYLGNKNNGIYPDGSTGCNFLNGLNNEDAKKAQAILKNLGIDNGNAYKPLKVMPFCNINPGKYTKPSQNLTLKIIKWLTADTQKDYEKVSPFGPFFHQIGVNRSDTKHYSSLEEKIIFDGKSSRHTDNFFSVASDENYYHITQDPTKEEKENVVYRFYSGCKNNLTLNYVIKTIQRPMNDPDEVLSIPLASN